MIATTYYLEEHRSSIILYNDHRIQLDWCRHGPVEWLPFTHTHQQQQQQQNLIKIIYS